MQIWKRLESEEVGNQYTRVVSFCSNKAAFMIHVSDVAKPIIVCIVLSIYACSQVTQHSIDSQGSWQYTALAAKKYFFIISGADSAYEDGSLHMQTLTVS